MALIGVCGITAWYWNYRRISASATNLQPHYPEDRLEKVIPSHPALHDQNTQIKTLWGPLQTPVKDVAMALALARSVDVSYPEKDLGRWAQLISQNKTSGGTFSKDVFIFNEAVETLRNKKEDIAQLHSALADILKESSLDEVLRDYSAQHLALIAEAHPEYLVQTVDLFCTMLEAISNRALAFPGTLLNSLDELRSQNLLDPFPYQQRLSVIIMEYLGTPSLPLPLQVSLIQTITEQETAGGLPVLRSLLANPDTPEPLLLAAASSLGRLGTVQDITLLEQTATAHSISAPAVDLAIGRLKNSKEKRK